MKDADILKALRTCTTPGRDGLCERCPYHRKYDEDSCVDTLCKDAIRLIEKQKVEIAKLTENVDILTVFNKLHEQDIADRDKMLESKVEEVYEDFVKDYRCLKEVYEDFVKDYRCLKEKFEGLYDEYGERRKESERLQKELIKKNDVLLRVRDLVKQLPQAICDNTSPDFNKDGRPVNVWKAKPGYDAVDDLIKQILSAIE